MIKYTVPLFFLLACAPSEEKFEAETIALTCEKMFECTSEEDIATAQEMGFWMFGADAAECESILNDSSEGTDDTAMADYVYDKAAAKECLAAMEAMTCEEVTSGVPAACEGVYTAAE